MNNLIKYVKNKLGLIDLQIAHDQSYVLIMGLLKNKINQETEIRLLKRNLGRTQQKLANLSKKFEKM